MRYTSDTSATAAAQAAIREKGKVTGQQVGRAARSLVIGVALTAGIALAAYPLGRSLKKIGSDVNVIDSNGVGWQGRCLTNAVFSEEFWQPHFQAGGRAGPSLIAGFSVKPSTVGLLAWRAGWPLHCAGGQVEYAKSTSPGSVDVSQAGRSILGLTLPAKLWVGPLLGNIAVFSTGTYVLILSWTTVRRLRRERSGVCVQCGYERFGLPINAPCPECGAEGSPTIKEQASPEVGAAQNGISSGPNSNPQARE